MSKSIIGTASLYTAGSMVTQALSFIAQITLMRNLTLADYGYYGLSFEVLILLQMVVGGAFRNFYLQSFRNNNADVNDLTYYQMANGSLYIAIFSIILYFLYGVAPIISISLTISFVLASLSLPLQTKMLANNQRMEIILKDIITAILSLITIFVSVKLLHLTIINVVIIQLVPAVIVSFVYMFIFQNEFFKSWNIKNFFSYAKFKYEPVLITFIFVFLVNSLHNKLGVLYIKHFSELSILALYIAAFKFINPTLFVQSSLVSAYVPNFISDKNFKFDTKVFFIFGVPGTIITILLYFLFPYAVSILGLTLYADTYPLIKVGCWFILTIFIYGPLSNYISVTGGQKFILVSNCIAFSFYIVFTIIVGSFFQGKNLALGVVFCFVLAECLIGLFYYFYLIRKKIKTSTFFPLSMLFIMMIVSFVFIKSI